jgi:hypothetical protein
MIVLILFLAAAITIGSGCNYNHHIDRKAVVDRHRIVSVSNNPKSPAQAGNGGFAFGVDITGLQTFIPFNTMSDWSWHSFLLPEGQHIDDFKGVNLKTHDRMIRYDINNDEQPALSSWLAGNPHRFNLGRIGFLILKSDGTKASLEDLKNVRQEVDLWSGIIYSFFKLEGTQVKVETTCHPSYDMVGISVESDLINKNQIKIVFDFPYPDTRQMSDYVGSYDQPDKHSSVIVHNNTNSVLISRNMDNTKYNVNINWSSNARFLSGDTISSKHRFYLDPVETDKISFTCEYSKDIPEHPVISTSDVLEESRLAWKDFWESGAAIDLSQSADPRWRELERRIVLSQYIMKVNESGSYPPQESGLVNNGWYGRFHFEMIWWHGVHYALWNRWPLFDKSLHVFRDYLPTSVDRAENQGYKGARWPKCTADLDRDWPHPIHALLIWQQPHPIYFAELDYRLHPVEATLEKWKDIVFRTADFMADYACYDKKSDRYVLGPPLYIVSENTDPYVTSNPGFELSYWRLGLQTAQEWRKRLGLRNDSTWEDVLNKLSYPPQSEGLYVTYEKIDSMWTKYNFEHPGLIGTFGMLPGCGVDTAIFRKTLEKVISTWNFNRTWGWDFPMVAMAAARSGYPDLAVDMLMHDSPGFQFDEHGLATGGPFPYFPSNGALLTAVAMMSAGWDGSVGKAPGFPKNGKWVVKYENFNTMP